MTNDLKGGKMAIQKCGKCRDGYLLVKKGRDNSVFLGCSNYKNNGTGCNKMLNKKYYYDQMGYEMEPEDVGANTNNQETKTRHTTESSQLHNEKPTQANIVPTEDTVNIIKADLEDVLYGEWNLNEVLYNILNALQNVSKVRYYGISMLVDILRGADNKRIFDNKLDRIPEFGLYKEMPRETIQSIIEWMIKEKLILKTKERYPVLHSTDEGLHYSEHVNVNKLKKYLEEEVVLRK